MGRRAAERSPQGISRWGRAGLALLACGLAGGLTNCYSTGDGQNPPTDRLYFPVGLRVSPGGAVLYAVNSDFDLQYNGGTLQTFDLRLLRGHAARFIEDLRKRNANLEANPLEHAAPNPFGEVPFVNPAKVKTDFDGNACGTRPAPSEVGALGEACAPIVDAKRYVRDTAIIGAFATDLLLSPTPEQMLQGSQRNMAAANLEPVVCPGPLAPAAKDDPNCPLPGIRIDDQNPNEPPKRSIRAHDRLFAPVRGNASLTWADVERDSFDTEVPDGPFGIFEIQCGKDSAGRCDAAHTAGEDANETGNSRHITMPGEPFGVTFSQDGTSIIVTHQNETKTSLFSTGLSYAQSATDLMPNPALKFVLDPVPVGGMGAAAVPHDRDAFVGLGPVARPGPAYLQTSRSVAEVTLIRQYPDERIAMQDPTAPSTPALSREFLNRELGYPITVGPSGTDSRGLAIDPTPRLECKAKIYARLSGNAPSVDDVRDIRACARRPARVFIANRSPSSLLIGEVGAGGSDDAVYNPDAFTLHTSVPLSAGPSKVFLAPVVESDGALALRVFVVCFDSATIFVYDPDRGQVENVIRVGLGPFAMAFDPFTFEEVATHMRVPPDPRYTELKSDGTPVLRRYRFAYVASFTNSFIQVLDLDNFGRSDTFERVVFTLGQPTQPKGL